MSIDALVEEAGRGTASWLMHGVWQTTAVALVAAGVLALMRHRSARSRYAVGCLALALIVAGPSASVLLAARTPAVAEPGDLPAMAAAPGGPVQAEPLAMTVFAPPLEASPSLLTAFTTRLPSALVILWLAGGGCRAGLADGGFPARHAAVAGGLDSRARGAPPAGAPGRGAAGASPAGGGPGVLPRPFAAGAGCDAAGARTATWRERAAHPGAAGGGAGA